MPEVMEEERERLRWTREAFSDIIGETREMYDALPGLYRDNPDLLGDLMLQTHNRIARLEAGQEKPYFARIDFTDMSGEREACYLSKVGVSDGENRLITVDWRAPVASLYYESNVGRARYEAPGGAVEGVLELKRQIEIERGELLGVRDVDTVIDDELLMPYLGVGADNRLKNIVASIQGEQNRIIREKIERTLVVQGAAGSGKTTVALHRIAYLAYTYRESIRNAQYLIIGPNPVFLRYISSVLPDLDVDRVPQYTFDSLAAEIIGERYTLTDRYDRLRETLAGEKSTGLERWKTSMRCRDALDRFLLRFGEDIAPADGFSIHGFPILSAGEVRRAYEDAAGDGTILARVERTVLILQRLVRQRQAVLEEKLSIFFRERYRAAGEMGSEKDLARLHQERAAVEKELETGCRKTLRAHFSSVDMKLLVLYRRFWEEGDLGPEYPYPDAKGTLSALRRRVLTPEDLAAVLYLCERVRGCPDWARYRHAIVDEAQDYGEFELYVLRRILSGCSFTVVGDLAQSIFGYRSIESWEPVLRDALPGAALYEVRKSYRTTVEIMEAANTVSAFLGLTPAEPVIRHGEPVGLYEASDAALTALVRARREEGYQSVAVITRTPEEAARALSMLRAEGIAALSPEEGEGGGEIAVLTAYQAKGLEFDAAILYNVSAYGSSSRTDMHLLYVAMTRPLHRLDLLCDGDVCAPLRSLPVRTISG